MKTIARILSLLSAALSIFLFVRLRSIEQFVWWPLKVLSGSLSGFVSVAGAVGAVLGLLKHSRLAVIAGAFGALASGNYIREVVAQHGQFWQAFGPDWRQELKENTSEEQRSHMLQKRWQLYMPQAPEPRLEQNVVFWRLPLEKADQPDLLNTERLLYCDVWRPPEGIHPTGLAFIYLHGGAWYLMDKDMGTRTFFRQLTSQGHVVMDVAYRMFPETKLGGMVEDAKRAVAWMKANGVKYGVDPEKIVLAGGSAGAHLALLAAYTPDIPELTPEDLKGVDTSVRAVVSYYGPSTLLISKWLDDYNRPLMDNSLSRILENPLVIKISQIAADLGVNLMKKTGTQEIVVGQKATMSALVGGNPGEVPELYDLFSPIAHVNPASPSTLIFQGTEDVLVPVEEARALYRKLKENDVPVVYIEYPQTDHGFDLILPEISPPTQAALYDLERFLALVQY